MGFCEWNGPVIIHTKMSLSLPELLIPEQNQLVKTEGKKWLLVGNQEYSLGTVVGIEHTVVFKTDAIPGELVGEVTDK